MESYFGAAISPSSLVPSKGFTILASLIAGYGATMGNGCTSGHGVCGIGRASPRSLAAVGIFMLSGMISSSFFRAARNHFGESSSLLGKVADWAFIRASDEPTWTLQSNAFLHSTLTVPWVVQLGAFVAYWLLLTWYLNFNIRSLYDIPALAKIRDLIFHKSSARRNKVANQATNGLAPVDSKKDEDVVGPGFEARVADIGEEEPEPEPSADGVRGRRKSIVPVSPATAPRRSAAEVAMLINQHLVAVATGFMFGYGLAFSGMGDPERVQSFLDPLGFGGKWDITLAFVMGGAVLPNMIGFKKLRDSGLSVQLLHGPHGLPVPFSQAIKYGLVDANLKIDAQLISGSLLFGLAWGALGICPGPAIVGFSTAKYPTYLAVPFIGIGALIRQFVATL